MFCATVAIVAMSATAADRPMEASDRPQAPSPSRKLWRWSLVAYGTANVLDVVSSTGPHYGHETNSFLAKSDGTFHTQRAMAVKTGVFAAIGISQYLIIQKWPQLTRLFTIVNFGWSAGETGIAIHNFRSKK